MKRAKYTDKTPDAFATTGKTYNVVMDFANVSLLLIVANDGRNHYYEKNRFEIVDTPED